MGQEIADCVLENSLTLPKRRLMELRTEQKSHEENKQANAPTPARQTETKENRQ